jgi:hypothetical protein
MQDIKSTKSDKPVNVSVIHLIWLPYGIALFEQFIASYIQFESGVEHELVLLFNGVNEKEAIQPYLSVIDKYNIPYSTLVHLGACQDLDAYFWAAGQLHSSYVIFLNSYVEFLAAGWLRCFMQHAAHDVGLLGATGSWQSYYRSALDGNWKWERHKAFFENCKKYRKFLKAIFWWSRFFYDFPNPHLRSNAFLIKRELFLSLKHKPLKNKFMAYVLESGKKSLTNQVLRKGLKVLLIDRSGNAYLQEQWRESDVFWRGSQVNLLIADNQTGLYNKADKENKRKMTQSAWGKDE